MRGALRWPRLRALREVPGQGSGRNTWVGWGGRLPRADRGETRWPQSPGRRIREGTLPTENTGVRGGPLRLPRKARLQTAGATWPRPRSDPPRVRLKSARPAAAVKHSHGPGAQSDQGTARWSGDEPQGGGPGFGRGRPGARGAVGILECVFGETGLKWGDKTNSSF